MVFINFQENGIDTMLESDKQLTLSRPSSQPISSRGMPKKAKASCPSTSGYLSSLPLLSHASSSGHGTRPPVRRIARAIVIAAYACHLVPCSAEKLDRPTTTSNPTENRAEGSSRTKRGGFHLIFRGGRNGLTPLGVCHSVLNAKKSTTRCDAMQYRC
nr:hypothetical protein B1D4.90 [imported] - Neurospora crassa [Neurospora crassa]